ncbi:hypothetical protein JW711_01435 [Candidatus Woesearchaeota archaeon]|nr:hypothetical protein [Candidatus Woesearchaeota archaeon]
MRARADKFLSGHYAYFSELPERTGRPAPVGIEGTDAMSDPVRCLGYVVQEEARELQRRQLKPDYRC